MNVWLLVGGLLSILLGAAHSVLGERLVLGPLFRRGDLPKLLGSTTFTRRTLRFTWHLTTALLVGIGGLVMALAASQLEPQTVWILRFFSLTYAACFLVSLIGARAKHFSWWVFLIISVLLWFGASA